MKLCLIEDDLLLGRSLTNALEALDHEVLWLRLAADARRFLRSAQFDAALLDLGLPDGDGIGLLQALRAQSNDLPVLVITARETLDERLMGFDAGADDYLVKPFDIEELDARLRAILRRTQYERGGEQVLIVGKLALDVRAHKATSDGSPLSLSPTEFEILRTLMQSEGRVLTRRQIEADAMPNSEGQSLDVHISNLRRKIGLDYIRTVRGIGYLIEAPT